MKTRAPASAGRAMPSSTMPAELVGAGLAGAAALDARGEGVRGDRGVGGGDRGAQDGDPGDPGPWVRTASPTRARCRARPRSVRRKAWGPSRRAPGLAGRAEPADPAAGFLLRAGLVQGDEADHHLLLAGPDMAAESAVSRVPDAGDKTGPPRPEPRDHNRPTVAARAAHARGTSSQGSRSDAIIARAPARHHGHKARTTRESAAHTLERLRGLPPGPAGLLSASAPVRRRRSRRSRGRSCGRASRPRRIW